ncbi:MAG: PEGA domain-containing protein [Thermodesulfobacteriota bacterium]
MYRLGRLKIQSRPSGTRILVNGRFRGTAPVEISDLKPSLPHLH